MKSSLEILDFVVVGDIGTRNGCCRSVCIGVRGEVSGSGVMMCLGAYDTM